jgi:hypothetical protein
MNTIDRINLRLKSGNNTPVERAYVTAEEWVAVKALVVACAKLRDAASVADNGWIEHLSAVYAEQDLAEALHALTEDKG